MLQIKKAQASVLEPFAGVSVYAEAGERVVMGQGIMQAALGWQVISAAARPSPMPSQTSRSCMPTKRSGTGG